MFFLLAWRPTFYDLLGNTCQTSFILFKIQHTNTNKHTRVVCMTLPKKRCVQKDSAHSVTYRKPISLFFFFKPVCALALRKLISMPNQFEMDV